MEVPDTPTTCLRRSSGELNVRLMLLYHVSFAVTPKLVDVGEHLKPSTRPYRQEWWLNHFLYSQRCDGYTMWRYPILQHPASGVARVN